VEREGKKYEEYAYVLDYLPHGKPGAPRHPYGRALVQLIGEAYFTLLEALPQRNADFNIRERIYIGKFGRTKIDHVIGRISYDELTPAARAELPGVIEQIVRSQEKRFIDFFNTSQPVTPRMHSLELIPGIGKRLMWQILEQREKEQFKSFEDLQRRVNLPDPARLIARRVLDELSKDEKYLIFTRPM
jgi:putative nucleotide binding protein